MSKDVNVEDIKVNEVDQMYLDQIANLKDKIDNEMMPKEEYDKLMAEHKKLTDDYINRRPAPKVEKAEPKPAREYAEKLMKVKSGDLTNRDYIKLSLDYREAYMAETGKDPWTDFTVSGSGRQNEDTNQVARALKSLVDENEDPVNFRIKMQSILEDDNALLSKLKNNKRRK